jgi:hypothetical protein
MKCARPACRCGTSQFARAAARKISRPSHTACAGRSPLSRVEPHIIARLYTYSADGMRAIVAVLMLSTRWRVLSPRARSAATQARCPGLRVVLRAELDATRAGTGSPFRCPCDSAMPIGGRGPFRSACVRLAGSRVRLTQRALRRNERASEACVRLKQSASEMVLNLAFATFPLRVATATGTRRGRWKTNAATCDPARQPAPEGRSLAADHLALQAPILRDRVRHPACSPVGNNAGRRSPASGTGRSAFPSHDNAPSP